MQYDNVSYKQDKQCTYKHKIAGYLRNHCCCGSSIRITYPECVCNLSYPAHNVHALYYTVICGLSDSTTFLHIISYTAQFLKKSY